MIVNTLGDKISERIQSMQDEIDRRAQESNELRATMFAVATQLRIDRDADTVELAAALKSLKKEGAR